MPDLGFYHPIVIHFAIALLTVGVVFRCLSLTGRARLGAGATGLILVGALATVIAVRSGDDAHDAVEGLPGLGSLVRTHQRWGHWTRDMAVAMATVELLALALERRADARALRIASAGIGIAASLAVLQTGKLGGELVYAHAGGIGIRSGDPEDVARLLLAGLYGQAEVDERSGRARDAATLLEIAARRFPADAAVQVRAAQALLEDRSDPEGALALLDGLGPITDDPRLRFLAGWLAATALDAVGRHADAHAALEHLRVEFPDDPRLLARLGRSR